jgi:hypothetical protein
VGDLQPPPDLARAPGVPGSAAPVRGMPGGRYLPFGRDTDSSRSFRHGTEVIADQIVDVVEMLSARAWKIRPRRAVLEGTGTGSRHLVPRRARPGSAARCARTTAPFGAPSSRLRSGRPGPFATRGQNWLLDRVVPGEGLSGQSPDRSPDASTATHLTTTPMHQSGHPECSQTGRGQACDSTSRKEEISDVA